MTDKAARQHFIEMFKTFSILIANLRSDIEPCLSYCAVNKNVKRILSHFESAHVLMNSSETLDAISEEPKVRL